MYRRAHPRIRGLLIFSVIAIVSAALATTAGAAPTSKPYIVEVTPLCASSTSGVEFQVTFTNQNRTSQSIGSADVTSPFPVTSARIGSTSIDTSGSVIRLREINIAPRGGTLVLDVTANLSGVAAGTYRWDVIAKQSNDFSGPPGNDFFLVTSGSSLVTYVDRCALEFTTQPADATTGAKITSVAGNPSGTPVRVTTKGPGGVTITSPSASIELSIAAGHNPGSTTLQGMRTVSTSSGVASFTSIWIGQSGVGYRLRAQAAGFTDALSSAFDIGDAVCQAHTTCQLPIETNEMSPEGATGTVTRTISTSGGASGGVIVASVGSTGGVNCPGYVEHTTNTLIFDVTTGQSKTVLIQIPKKQVQADPNNGAAFYQICYSNDSGFTDLSGNDVAAGAEGLLPDCTYDGSGNVQNAPCVHIRNKTRAGDMLIGFTAPPGDPRGRT